MKLRRPRPGKAGTAATLTAALLLVALPAAALSADNYSAPTNLGGTKNGVYTDAQAVTYNGSGYTIAVLDGAFYPNAPQFKNADGSSAVIMETCIGQSTGSFPSLCSAPTTANRSSYPWETRTGTFLIQSGANSSKPSNAPGNTCVDSGNTDDGLCQASHGTQTAGIAAGRPATRNDPTLGSFTYSGVAPGAKLALVKVGGGTGNNQSGWPAASILDALSMLEQTMRSPTSGALRTNPITAVSISFNGASSNTEAACAAGSEGARIDAAAGRLKAYGVAVIMTAGNDAKTAGTGVWTCGSNIVVVGATEVSAPTVPTAYSNLSSNVDLLAPVGNNGWPCPTNNCIFAPHKATGGSGAVWGTSMAAPQVAGAFAVLRQKYPLASVDRLIGLMKSSGKSLTGARASQAPNAKVLDLDAALDSWLPYQ